MPLLIIASHLVAGDQVCVTVILTVTAFLNNVTGGSA
jgi:hypothetical protein